MNEMYYDVCESTWLIVRHHTNLRQCYLLAIYVGKIEKQCTYYIIQNFCLTFIFSKNIVDFKQFLGLYTI